MNTLTRISLLLALVASPAFAADEAKKPDAKPLPKWEAMDYGRFLAASIDNTQGESPFKQRGCAANKAVMVNLGNRDAGYAFDTETLRGAGGWTGGWMKFKGVAFDGGHGPNPSPAAGAKVFFETNPGPGWSFNGSFAETRTLPVGPNAATIALGPLPREHAKYQGLYLHGDRVVFAYSVGKAEILESAEMETIGTNVVLSRSFTVVKGELDSSVRLMDLPYGGKADLADSANAIVRMELPMPTADAKKPAKKTDAKVAKNAPTLVKPADELTTVTVNGLPAGSALSVNGNFLSLKLAKVAAGTSFKVSFAHGNINSGDVLRKITAQTAVAADLRTFTKGGPAHWTKDVVTEGVLGDIDQDKQADKVKAQIESENDAGQKQALKDKLAEILNSPYVVDNVTVPSDNPYNSWIRVGAIDFFKDGRIAFATWSGDVWIGKFSDEKLGKITWHRFATGIFHGLGLKIVNEQIYVLGRDQITLLHDFNNDGEADFYENFNNDVQVTSNFHEFTFDLQTDSQGNFYFLKGGPVNPGGRGWGPLSNHHGCIFKVSADGKKFEVHATGIRAPNGMCVGPNDEISNGDNQGTWVPVDYIHYSKPGDFIEVPDLSHQNTPPTKYSPHLCWVPYDVDNSNGSQIWVPANKGKWGPFEGRMLYLSYGKSSLFAVLQERVGDVAQGGVVKFPLKFATGLMRARFSPIDGQLYVAGLKGWQTNGVKDGAIQRVRYTGKSVTMQESLHVSTQGITIGFTGALDKKTAADLQNWSISQYNYRWTGEYGSAEYKVSNPDQKGNDTVAIKSVKLSDDGKSVFLEVPGLVPVMQMRIKMNVKAVDGTRVPDDIGSTINVVPEKEGQDYRSFAK
jgi:glucose/arabinose dehydrogenase